jgi:L-serine dehydratase
VWARDWGVRFNGRLNLLGKNRIAFVENDHLTMIRKALSCQPNDMILHAFDAFGIQLRSHDYYSVGGGFVVGKEAVGQGRIVENTTPLAFSFRTGNQLLAICAENGLSISQIMARNELAWRPEEDTRLGLMHIWQVMRDCVRAGCHNVSGRGRCCLLHGGRGALRSTGRYPKPS